MQEPLGGHGARHGEVVQSPQREVEAVADELGNTGRILVRDSGTEPLVRVMVEAESKEQCQTLAERVVNVIKDKGHTV